MGQLDKFTLDRGESILLVIDLQDRLVPPMKYGKQVIKKTNILLSIAEDLGIPVIVTEQYPQGLGKTVPEVNIGSEAAIFAKTTFSACTEEVLSELERLGRKKIIITGMETHVCVFQTARDLLALGYQVFVVEDAVCSRTKENFRNALSLMSQMGAVVTSTELVFFDLMKEADTPEFRKLSHLIK